MAKKVLALDTNGELTYCVAEPENRGKGRCNHLAHQKDGESIAEFNERIYDLQLELQEKKKNDSKKALEKDEKELKEKDEFYGYENKDGSSNFISQEQIDAVAAKLDEVAGERLTVDNFKKILNKLGPDQMNEIVRLSFNAAPKFSLPISDEEYENENMKNKLYFANLPAYGIGNTSSISQMFDKVGDVPVLGGTGTIEHSYEEGLTPDEYFMAQFGARDALINKGVTTSKPGYTARKLFYAMSDTMVVEDCGGPYIDAMHCNLPEGHVCEKCAHLTQGGERVKKGMLIGGWISTNMSEALTQLSMKQKHVGGTQIVKQLNTSNTIMHTLDGWSTSQVIQDMQKAESTEEMREILYNGLKDAYASANIKQDEFNIQMVARKLTSYKRENGSVRPINPGEKADIVSMATVGNANNIFKVSELTSGYKHLTVPKKEKLKEDAANQIMR